MLFDEKDDLDDEQDEGDVDDDDAEESAKGRGNAVSRGLSATAKARVREEASLHELDEIGGQVIVIRHRCSAAGRRARIAKRDDRRSTDRDEAQEDHDEEVDSKDDQTGEK